MGEIAAEIVRVAMATERLATEVGRIRQILDEMTLPEPESVSTECLHPLDQRISFGRTHGVDDWQCKVCGYRVSAEEPVHA